MRWRVPCVGRQNRKSGRLRLDQSRHGAPHANRDHFSQIPARQRARGSARWMSHRSSPRTCVRRRASHGHEGGRCLLRLDSVRVWPPGQARILSLCICFLQAEPSSRSFLVSYLSLPASILSSPAYRPPSFPRRHTGLPPFPAGMPPSQDRNKLVNPVGILVQVGDNTLQFLDAERGRCS